MKKMISIIAFTTLPAFAMAGSGHTDTHHGNAVNAKGHHDHATSSMNHAEEGSHKADAGKPGDPEKVTRTIEVSMEDSMRFAPGNMTFDAGETVRFIVRNNGKITHEMVIGSVDELREHADMMRTMPTMKHTESNMISLDSGKQGELIWQFSQPGTFDFACLVPGHLEAGMTGKIAVNRVSSH
ncbi:putative cupredoxin-like copper-binding protein [Thiogranum longum]|uniref:Putative cupredoxin-like copper-binding protein n=1 Tax=Thiogranum longum TaxID=1537524 RepID=A0A4R1HCN6_9GAMM|nr:cupredoxin family protein [Thiogranum longum]TCK18025.1 putative cupredoxin-like copper-binding protein [Thiogranum longum]